MSTDKLSDPGNILLRIFQHVGRHIVRGGHLHTAELMQLEVLLIFSYSFLRKEDRTRIVNYNSEG